MEAAALCNFGIYAGDMRLRLRMFKSAFSGQLQMEDKFGNLYSRAVTYLRSFYDVVLLTIFNFVFLFLL